MKSIALLIVGLILHLVEKFNPDIFSTVEGGVMMGFAVLGMIIGSIVTYIQIVRSWG